MIDVYDGSIGVLTDNSKLIYQLNEYMTSENEVLNYEVREDKTKVVIITGKNMIEKDLPMWSHPLIFDNLRREKVVAIDLRPYMVGKLDDMINVREKMQDKYNGTLQMYRLVFTKLIMDGELLWLNYSRTSLMIAFAKIISTTTSMILYTDSIGKQVEIMAKLHFLSMGTSVDEFDFDELIRKLPREDVKDLMHGELKELYSIIKFKYNADELVFPSTTIGSMVNNIQAVTTNGRADGLSPDIYAQTLSTGFYSLDSKYLAMALIEDLPTFVAIVTMVVTESINGKSSFKKIINNNKTTIKSKELVELLMKTYKEEILAG